MSKTPQIIVTALLIGAGFGGGWFLGQRSAPKHKGSSSKDPAKLDDLEKRLSRAKSDVTKYKTAYQKKRAEHQQAVKALSAQLTKSKTKDAPKTKDKGKGKGKEKEPTDNEKIDALLTALEKKEQQLEDALDAIDAAEETINELEDEIERLRRGGGG